MLHIFRLAKIVRTSSRIACFAHWVRCRFSHSPVARHLAIKRARTHTHRHWQRRVCSPIEVGDRAIDLLNETIGCGGWLRARVVERKRLLISWRWLKSGSDDWRQYRGAHRQMVMHSIWCTVMDYEPNENDCRIEWAYWSIYILDG